MQLTLKTFPDYLRAVASNFNWHLDGERIIGERGGLEYDPLTALVQIIRGEYLGKHEVIHAAGKLGGNLSMKDVGDILVASCKPDYTDREMVKYRIEIKKSVGLFQN